MSITMIPGLTAMENITCLLDISHETTAPINAYFLNNPVQRKAYLIISGIILDILLITTLVYWVVKIKTWRYAIAISALYLFKLILKVRIT